MRITERLMYILGACLAVTYGFEEFLWSFALVCVLILVILIGAAYEGVRFAQWIFIVAFIGHIVLVVMDVFSIIALIIYCSFLLFAILCTIAFGEGNLDGIKMTGPFQVGHKDIHSSKDGIALSVYYPMDREEYDKTINQNSRNTQWMRYGYMSRKGITYATAAWGTEEGPSPWLYRYLDFIKMNTVQDGELAKEFREEAGSDPPRRLIPIVFSHGLTCNRTSYSGICRDLASHGYIVFALDHFDGTAHYARLQSGEEKVWTSAQAWDSMEFRKANALQRKGEVMNFIDDLEQDKFAQQTLGFDGEVCIDMEKLVMGGHSMGGITAIITTEADSRIKAVFTYDPWLWIRVEDIQDGTLSLKQPQFHIESEGFAPLCECYFCYNNDHQLENLARNSEGPHRQYLYMRQTNHYHQCDVIVVIPFESFLKTCDCIQLNYIQLYLLNSKCTLEYLHSIGFNNAKYPDKELEDAYKQIKECKEDYLEYKIKIQSNNSNTPNSDDMEANKNEEIENDEEQALLDGKSKTN